MVALERLEARQLQQVMATYRDALRDHQDAINRLNVYPVPDGDTGTNMALTVEAVVAELDTTSPDDLASTCKAISHGSLMGARGNSGVILSQILRGLTEVLRGDRAPEGDGAAERGGNGAASVWARALHDAAEAAYGAVMRPVEGTILTVVRESAAAATEAAGAGAPMVEMFDAARAAAAASLERTPELLPVLAEAGVVDAGGSGYLLFLDALLAVVDGRDLPEPPVDGGPVGRGTAGQGTAGTGPAGAGSPHVHGDLHSVTDLRYEVMYLLDAPDDTIPAFKDVWAGIGDSIVVVGGDGLWNCHIHTDDIGGAIEAALDCGRPRQIRITDLHEQVEEERWVREAGADARLPGEHHHEQVTTAVVAVASGDGVQRIFHSLGVQGIVAGGQSMNPSTAQLLGAVEAANASSVIILPNNKNIVPVAEQVDGETDKEVRVVPTHGIPEGFASLLAYDPQASVDDNADAMWEAASAVVPGEVCQAVRDSSCDLGPIAQGDWMGFGPGGIHAVEIDLAGATVGLLDRLVTDDHEIVTVIEGEGSSAGVTRHLSEWLADHRPDVTVEVHHGGQPLYPYLFGIE